MDIRLDVASLSLARLSTCSAENIHSREFMIDMMAWKSATSATGCNSSA